MRVCELAGRRAGAHRGVQQLRAVQRHVGVFGEAAHHRRARGVVVALEEGQPRARDREVDLQRRRGRARVGAADLLQQGGGGEGVAGLRRRLRPEQPRGDERSGRVVALELRLALRHPALGVLVAAGEEVEVAEHRRRAARREVVVLPDGVAHHLRHPSAHLGPVLARLDADRRAHHQRVLVALVRDRDRRPQLQRERVGLARAAAVVQVREVHALHPQARALAERAVGEQLLRRLHAAREALAQRRQLEIHGLEPGPPDVAGTPVARAPQQRPRLLRLLEAPEQDPDALDQILACELLGHLGALDRGERVLRLAVAPAHVVGAREQQRGLRAPAGLARERREPRAEIGVAGAVGRAGGVDEHVERDRLARVEQPARDPQRVVGRARPAAPHQLGEPQPRGVGADGGHARVDHVAVDRVGEDHVAALRRRRSPTRARAPRPPAADRCRRARSSRRAASAPRARAARAPAPHRRRARSCAR